MTATGEPTTAQNQMPSHRDTKGTNQHSPTFSSRDRHRRRSPLSLRVDDGLSDNGVPSSKVPKVVRDSSVRLLGIDDLVWRSMAILKTADRRSERRIREFIFAWRYPWLKAAVAVALVVAAMLLVITVVVGRARRARKAQVP